MSQKNHFVFAVRGVESGRVQIGHAANPANKLVAMQAGCPETLILVSGKPFEDDQQALAFEAKLQNKFAGDHIHNGWYKGSDAVMSEVTSQSWLSPEDVAQKQKVYRVPVLINKDVYDKVKAYADSVGVPVTRAFNEIAADWMETVGEARMESIVEKYAAAAGSN